ncbi:MAG: cytoplasmic protein [Firmicutes bacterium]|nr:cytoplasmic protein [Bacillota bacterium]
MMKVAYFAFNGKLMCFQHLLLNVLDLHEKGHEVKLIIEGEAVKLLKELVESKHPLFAKVRELNLIDSICKACSATLGVLEYNETLGIPINGDMNGHPPMEPYLKEGYQVIVL